jgi:hypothetical protein
MNWTSELVREAANPSTGMDQVLEGQSACVPPAARGPALTLNAIYRLARRKWEAAGRPPGDSARFWLEAEEELRQRSHQRTPQ